jgi:hypothetical protein
MVNISLIEQLSRITRNSGPMMKWSDRFRRGQDQELSWYLKIMSKKIKNLLNLISGNDTIEMLKGLKSYFFCCI